MADNKDFYVRCDYLSSSLFLSLSFSLSLSLSLSLRIIVFDYDYLSYILDTTLATRANLATSFWSLSSTRMVSVICFH